MQLGKFELGAKVLIRERGLRGSVVEAEFNAETFTTRYKVVLGQAMDLLGRRVSYWFKEEELMLAGVVVDVGPVSLDKLVRYLPSGLKALTTDGKD